MGSYDGQRSETLVCLLIVVIRWWKNAWPAVRAWHSIPRVTRLARRCGTSAYIITSYGAATASHGIFQFEHMIYIILLIIV